MRPPVYPLGATIGFLILVLLLTFYHQSYLKKVNNDNENTIVFDNSDVMPQNTIVNENDFIFIDSHEELEKRKLQLSENSVGLYIINGFIIWTVKFHPFTNYWRIDIKTDADGILTSGMYKCNKEPKGFLVENLFAFQSFNNSNKIKVRAYVIIKKSDTYGYIHKLEKLTQIQ